jgi:Delta14-sterol reductase
MAAISAPILVLSIYVISLILHLLVPTKRTTGYVCSNEGIPRRYKLNGLLVLLLVTFIFFALVTNYSAHIFDPLYSDVLSSVFTANIAGLLSSMYFVFIHPTQEEPYARCVTTDQITVLKRTSDDEVISVKLNKSKLQKSIASTSIPLQFFLGREWNPQIFFQLVDVKMFLYLVGAVLLQINILTGSLQKNVSSLRPNAIGSFVGMFTFFIVEYLYNEQVHLYTYDLFAEKTGFKLIWGCLVFYPFFYAIGMYGIIEADIHSADISSTTCIIILMVFFSGWILTRGANLQKFYWKNNKNDKFVLFGLVEQVALASSENRILISGFWRLARHVNYFGEIIQSIAITLPCLFVSNSSFYNGIALLYPFYYIVLFVTRQIDDDEVCRNKYGVKVWAEYCKIVPYRIIPWIW